MFIFSLINYILFDEKEVSAKFLAKSVMPLALFTRNVSHLSLPHFKFHLTKELNQILMNSLNVLRKLKCYSQII